MCVSTARTPSGYLDFPDLVEFLRLFDFKGFGCTAAQLGSAAQSLMSAWGSVLEAAASVCNPFPNDPLVSVRELTVLLLCKTSFVFIPPGTSVYATSLEFSTIS